VDAKASTAGNWIGGVAPVAGDHVVFGDTTPAASCTWDLAIAVSSVDFEGVYSGTVTLAADMVSSGTILSTATAAAYLDLNGRRLAVAGDLRADGLTLESGVAGSTLAFDGALTSFATKSDGPIRAENATVEKSAGVRATIGADLVLGGSFTVLGGTAAPAGVRLELGGDLVLNGGLFDASVSTVVFAGSSPQQTTGNGSGSATSFADLFVQNPTTTTLRGVNISVLIATRPAATVQFYAGDAFSVGTLAVSGGARATPVRLVSSSPGAQSTLGVTGTASVDFAFVRDLNSNTGIALTATRSLDGGNNSNWTVSVGGVQVIWDWAGGDALASNAANWIGGVAPSTADYAVFGSTTPSASCTWDLDVQIASVSVVGSYAGTVALANDLSASGGATLTAPAATLDLAGHAARLGGGWSAGATTVTGVAGSSVSFEGSGAADIASTSGQAGRVDLPAVSIAKTGAATVGLSAGLTLARDFEVLGGTFSAGGFLNALGGSLRVLGGYFEAENSTFVFTGSAAEAVSVAAAGDASRVAAFYAQGSSETTFGAWTADLLVDTRPASALRFATGASTATIGTLTVDGGAIGTRILMSGPGALSVASASVRFATVTALTASAGATIPAQFSLDGGGNANWSISSTGGAVRIWSYGGTDSLASTAGNWSGGVAPSTGDFVVFGDTTPGAACTWDLGIQLSSFSMIGSYAGTVSLSTDLAASEGVRLDAASGRLDPGGRAIADGGDWSSRPGVLTGSVLTSSVVFNGSSDATVSSLGGSAVSFGNIVSAKASAAFLTLAADALPGGSFEITGGTLAAGSHRLEIGDDIKLDGGYLDVSRSTLVFVGSSPQLTTGNGLGAISSVGGVYVQNPTTTTILDVAADVFVATTPSSSIVFGTTGGSPTFGAFTVNGQASGTRVTVQGMSANSPLKVTGYGSVDYASIKDIDASGGVALTATHSLDGGGNTNWTITDVGGAKPVWRWAGGNALASNGANWTTGVAPSTGDFVLFGASTPAAACTWDLAVAVASISVSGVYAGTVTLAADLVVGGAGVRLDAPAAVVDFAGHKALDSGDWTAGTVLLKSSVSGSSVVFVGSGDSNVSGLNGLVAGFEYFVSSKDAGGRVVAGSNLSMSADFTILSGTFTAPGRTLALQGDMVSDGGYLQLAGSTVVFAGATAQTLTGNGQGGLDGFGEIAIQTVQTVTLPDVPVSVFVATQPNATIQLNAPSSALTVGTLKLDGGGATTRVRLQSLTAGTSAGLTVTSTAAVSNARIQDIDASGGRQVVATNSLDLGGNTNWSFVTNGEGIQGAEFQGAFVTSLTAVWYANFSGTPSYLAELSTEAFPNADAANQSSTTLNTTATFTGLTPDTLYHARVSTGPTAVFTDAGTTVTLSALPLSPAVAAAYLSSATLTWGANGNPGDTQYLAQASVDAFGSIAASSSVYGTSATVSGLESNATVYLRVESLDRGGQASGFVSAGTTVTLVATPAASAAPTVSSGSVEASWSGGGNASDTRYELQLSTDGWATLVDSAFPSAAAAAFGGLAPSTTYQLRVRAIARDGSPTAFVELSSATTLLGPPGQAGVPFPAVGVSSAAVAWGAAGGGATYEAQASTDAFATVVASSATANLNALFGTGGAGGALTPNTTYQFRVRAYQSGNYSAYVTIGSTPTLAVDPSGPAAQDVRASSGTWAWASGGNPAGTRYLAQVSSDSFATVAGSSETAGTNAGFTGLAANTAYAFRVAADGWNARNAFISAASSATQPSAPSASGFTLFQTSASAAWTDADAGALAFAAEVSSDSFATLTASSANATSPAPVTGLAVDTTYYLRVRATGVSGASALSGALVGMSGTYPPASVVPVTVSSETLTVSWSANGNPGGVLYDAQASTDGFVTAASSRTTGTTATVSGLMGDTTYQLRVRSVNLAGTAGVFVAGASTVTAVATPGAQPVTGVGAAQITAVWDSGGNGPGTVYETQSTTDSFVTLDESTRTAAYSFTYTGLTSDTTYEFRVRAIGHDGTATPFAALGSTRTFLLIPGSPAQPVAGIGVSSVTFAWTSGGNGPGTVYETELSTDSFASVSFTSSTRNLQAVFGTGGAGPALLGDTTYFARVRAVSGAGGTGYAGLGSTATYAADPSAPVFATPASTTAITLDWTAANSTVTLYASQISTDSFATLTSFSTGIGTTASYYGLTPDATYQLRVRTVGIYGNGPYVTVSTWTQPSPPTAVAAAAAGVSSATVSWSGVNAAGAPYLVELSSAGFPQVAASSTTASLSAVFTGLDGNTTYYPRVRALAPDGSGPDFVVGVETATPAAAPASPAASAVGATTGTWTWGLAGNGPTQYRVEVSTDASFASAVQAQTVSASSAAGAAAYFTGLTANASEYARVRAEGWTAPSAYASAPPAITDADTPGASAPTSVSSGSVVANWTAAANAAGTVYEAQVSTDAFATVNASSLTAATAAAFTGLQAATAYSFRVRATGLARDSAFATLASTSTLPAPPGLPGQPVGAVGVSSVAVSWTSGGNAPGTLYRADASTDAFATLVASSATYALSAVFGTGGAGALQPDTTYQLRVAAVNGPTFSAFVALGSTATVPADPASPSATTISTQTATLAWTAGGNPGDALYEAQASTDAFATVAASARVASLSVVLPGLAQDTTVQLRVRAVGRAGTPTAFVAAADTVTAAAAPVPAAPLFGTVSTTLSWSANGNPASTGYELQLSTDSFGTLVVSTAGAFASGTFSGLTPNTTYQARVRALGIAAATPYAAFATSATAALPPSGVSAAALGLSSASVSWSSGGDPAGTVYEAQVSTDAFATVNASSATAGLTAAFTGLESNATEYLRVRARAWSGGDSAFVSGGSTVTPAAVPVSAPLVSVGTGSLVAAWTSADAAGTLYELQISTDGFSSVNDTAWTTALQAGFGGLASNTAYVLRVQAVARDGAPTGFAILPSTTTKIQTPGVPGVPFPAPGVSSVTVSWTSGGNGAGTTYRAQLSTDSFATIVVGSDTANLAALFGTGGEGGALPPNQLYQARVYAIGGAGLSAPVVLGSTATAAYAPAGLTVVASDSATATLDWSPNGDPEPGTSYELQYDVSAAFPSPSSVSVATSAASPTGLSAATTYYFRARVIGAAGAPSGWSASVSTETQPSPPGSPGTPAATGLGVSSLSWTWSAAPRAWTYRVYADTSGAALLNVQSSATFVESALTPNTSWPLTVAAVNGSGAGPLSAPATGWTLAAPPGFSAASSVYLTSATLTWALNGNPAGTEAEVQRSTDGVSYASASTTTAAAYTDSSLAECTTYWFRVRNLNAVGVASAFDAAINFTTLESTPAAPSSLAAEPLTLSRISLSWNASPSAGVAGYRLYSDGGSGTVDYATPYASLAASATTFVTPTLVSSGAYVFALRAVNACGVEDKNVTVRAAAPAAATPEVLRAEIVSPPGGLSVAGDRVTVAAALAAGDLASVGKVLLQYRASGAAAWTDLSAALAAHPNPGLSAPYYAQWDVTGLGAGAYDLRAVAYATGGSSDTAPSFVTISVDPASPDISENAISGGRVRRDQKIYAAVDNRVQVGGGASGDPLITLDLPAGALSGSTATLSLVSDPDLTGISTGSVGGGNVGLYAQVTLSNGQSLLNGRTARLTLSYPDADGDGRLDGSGVSPASLRCYSYDSAGAAWKADQGTSFDPAARTVTCATPHFTLFGVFSPLSAVTTLDEVRVFPVPYRPDGSDPDAGRPYSPGVADSGIVFSGLPSSARIRIYAVDGRLVADLDNRGASRLQWDARNGRGKDVASGAYFAVISSPGLKTVTRRLSIIR
jgi:hypothetical protein